MSDSNRLELDIVATEDTERATTKAKANFQSVEQQAAKSAAGMSKVFDAYGLEFAKSIDTASTRSMRSLEKLEARAALAGKNGVEKLLVQRDAMIRSLGGDEVAIQRTVGAYDRLVKARQKYDEQRKKADEEVGGFHGNPRRLLLGAKDFLEGYQRGAVIEATDYLIGTSGQGGILKGAVGSISAITGLSTTAVTAIGGVIVSIVALEVAGLKAMHDIAEKGREFENISLRTGLPVSSIQAFQYAAKASGQDPNILEKLTRGLAQTADDNSSAGAKARQEVARLGVTFRDQFGDLKPTEQIILELADGINQLPPGLQRSAASMEIFKRVGIEAVPFLTDLRKNLQASGELGKTFSDADLALAKTYHETFTKLGEEWIRLKLQIEAPLAIVASITLKGFHLASSADDFADQIARYAALSVVPESIEGKPGVPQNAYFPDGSKGPYVGPPGTEFAQKFADRATADAEIRAELGFLGIKTQIEDARKKLQEIAVPKVGESSLEQERDYTAAANHLRQLEDTQKALTAGAQDQIAVEKQRLQLASQLAEVQASSKLRDIRAQLDRSKELASPEDISEVLALTRERVDRETEQRIQDRSKRVDENGRLIDLSGTRGFQQFAARERGLAPQRLELETAKVLDEFKVLGDRYFQARTDADFKAFEEAEKRKLEAKHSLINEIARLDAQARTHYFDAQNADNERQKNLALSQLGLIDAQSVREKQSLEDQKLAIETSYAQRALQVQIQRIQSEESVELGKLQALANVAGPEGQSYYDEASADVRNKANADIAQAQQAAADKELIFAQDVANKKTQLGIEQNRKIFDSLKQSANGLFDALFEKSKSFADVLKGLLKTAILTPIKDIFSKQVAGLFTELLTGQKVSYGEIGTGKGFFGKIGSALGRAGLGPERFGPEQNTHKVNLPNHLGDVSLIRGAVPVVVMNGGQGSSGPGALSLSSLPLTTFGLFASGGRGFFPGAARGGSAISSSITYPDGSTDFGGGATSGLDTIFGQLPGAPAYQGSGIGTDSLGGSSTGGGFFSKIGGFVGKLFGGGSGADYTGRSLDTSGGATSGLQGIFGQLPGAPAYNGGDGSAGSSGGGFFSGILGKIGSVFGGGGGGSGGDSGDSGDDSEGGGVGGPVGALLLSAGIGLGIDGLKRGGTAGIFETAGGGAAIGAKFGGVEGAFIGAAIGGAAGLIRKFLFQTDRDHTKELVKQVYGLKINDSTADAIIQIAKQKYGGAISIAVRSQEVRDLLKLYAETIGDKKGQAQFVADKVHSASLVESGGRLQQQAIYDNGQAYAYQSPLSTYGGGDVAPLPTAGRDAGTVSIGSLQLVANGQSASDLLAGQVARVATPGYIQSGSLAASQASNGRLDQTALTLLPSAITR